jgi:hypothetical protein
MFEFSTVPPTRIAIFAGILAASGALGGYAIHEHNAASALAAKNEQTTAALNQTQHELADLASKVNVLAARSETQPATAPQSGAAPAGPGRPAPSRTRKDDPRIKKLQNQLDAQSKAIEETRGDLALTQGDLVDTRSVLSGSIAHTHDELVLLQKKGERNYAEFDIGKAKQFEHKGPFGIRLKKANVKHQFADLELMVDDRNLSQKHVNLYQPVMFYTPDSPQPVEVVINSIGKDHIHGYISSSKYRQSELAAVATTSDDTAPAADQPATPTPTPAPRKKLPLPQ